MGSSSQEPDGASDELPLPDASPHPASPWAALSAAVQFLLVTPAFIRRTFTDREMGASVGFYPLVGALLGAALLALDMLLALIFPPAVRSVAVMIAWALLTGALHIDGFLDACDGLLGGFTPEKRLAIMRDERVGAYALVGGGLLLLLQYSALNAVSGGEPRAALLLLAPVMGRWGMALALVARPYARPSGLGRAIKNNAGAAQAAWASGFALAALAAAALTGLLDASGGWFAAVRIAAAGALTAWAATGFALHRIPGLTGDIYGAIVILIETAVLLVMAAG